MKINSNIWNQVQFLGLGINFTHSEKEKLFLTDHAENADLLDLEL